MAARLRALEGFGLMCYDQRSGFRIYAFLAFLGCAVRQVTPAGSLDAPPRRLKAGRLPGLGDRDRRCLFIIYFASSFRLIFII